MRLCPKCGKRSEEARCPEDGTATLVLAANPDSRLALGTEINGRYRVREMIGQGGFGSVYRATSIATDQDMAIKLLAVSLDSDDSDMIQRFFAEAQVTASLKHPNTIRVYDFGQTEGGALYIAMELLSGVPLNELLRKRGQEGRVLTEEETLNIGVQALRSLAEAHLANLVHRDLKPHNLFLHEVEGDDPVVKVLDFGIAKKLGTNLTGTGKAFGTPSYMSPEQAQNKPLDRRSDLYSLGCVLYQCLAGKPPFDGENPLSVLLSHVAEPPPDLRTTARTPVSEAMVRVIEKSLKKDPNDRFNTAIEMRQALEACRGADRTEQALRVPQGVSPLPMASGAEKDEKTAAYDAKGAENRTAAYAVPSQGTPRPAPLAVSGVHAPGAVQGADQPTFGFFSASDSEAGAAPIPPPTAAVKPPPVLLFLAIALAIGLVAGAGWWWHSRGASADGGSAAATGSSVAGVVSAKSAASSGDSPAPSADAAATAPVADAAVAVAVDTAQAADTVQAVAPAVVKLQTDPAGAQVQVDGRTLGVSPVDIRMVGHDRVTVSLNLAGYVAREVDVLPEDAKQGRLVKLDKLPEQAQPPANGGKKTPPVRTKVDKPKVDKPGGDSPLNERL